MSATIRASVIYSTKTNHAVPDINIILGIKSGRLLCLIAITMNSCVPNNQYITPKIIFTTGGAVFIVCNARTNMYMLAPIKHSSIAISSMPISFVYYKIRDCAELFIVAQSRMGLKRLFYICLFQILDEVFAQALEHVHTCVVTKVYAVVAVGVERHLKVLAGLVQLVNVA